MMAVCAPLLPTDDTTRVVLKNVADETGADYINANHLAVSTYHHVCWEGPSDGTITYSSQTLTVLTTAPPPPSD